jgi:ABC-type tungstate transport system substrate-binding protein
MKVTAETLIGAMLSYAMAILDGLVSYVRTLLEPMINAAITVVIALVLKLSKVEGDYQKPTVFTSLKQASTFLYGLILFNLMNRIC